MAFGAYLIKILSFGDYGDYILTYFLAIFYSFIWSGDTIFYYSLNIYSYRILLNYNYSLEVSTSMS